MTLNTKNLISKIPKEVSYVTETIEKAGFEAHLVGGCVRDLLMSVLLDDLESKRTPKDWDITTNAKPEQIVSLFEKTIYENNFGTVGVCVPYETGDTNVSYGTGSENVIHETKYHIIEVTPFRIEAKYSDFRHPDEVKFTDNIEEDLARRDFTVNATSFRPSKGHLGIKDIYGGIKDIQNKILKAVGNPDDRFSEDALRMLRAVRFACQLNFSVSHETMESILKNSSLIKNISQERIRDEFVKIIMSKNGSAGIAMLQKFNLLKNIIPELEEGIGCEQSGEHIYDVWNHLLHALQHAIDKDWPLEVRLAALFHDIGKPKSRRNTFGGELEKNFEDGRFTPKEGGMSKNLFPVSSKKKKYTFYGHEVVGLRMTKKIMERLKFSKKESDLVETLVRNHMFFSDTEKITLSAVRRIVVKVGKENIWNLMNVRECDRVGMKKKEAPYRLRKYFAMIEEALRDPVSVGQLKIDGKYMIENLNITPGPRMGWILHALLEEVLDAPEKNTVEHLSELVKSLNMLGDEELRVLGERGKEKKEELEEEEVAKLHEKHGVKK